MKIHKNDIVLIISGKDKGRKGKVIKASPKEERLSIEGINLRKKHRKPRKSGEKGQIIEFPSPLHLSNVKLICTKCQKATRIGYKVENKRKYRFCKKCNQEV